jgi:hypothetical protein
MNEQIEPSPIPGSHERDFGHETEDTIANCLQELPTIEKVQKSTPEEDGNGTDYWIWFRGWGPAGVEFSISDSRDRLQQKISRYPMRSQKAGESNVIYTVLVTGEKKDFAGWDRRYQIMRANKPDLKPHQVIPPYAVARLYGQLVEGYIKALEEPRLQESFRQTLLRHSQRKS